MLNGDVATGNDGDLSEGETADFKDFFKFIPALRLLECSRNLRSRLKFL
jgi:hypothetical protein